ncbi:hypothetical protein EON66_06005, partial [archaeon]
MQSLEWSEFTSFCIEAGIAASGHRVRKPTFYFMYDNKFEDVVTRSPSMLQMTYHPIIDCIITIDGTGSFVNVFNSHLQLLRVLDTRSANRRTTKAIDNALPLRHVIMPAFRMIAVLLSNLTIPLWIATPRSFLFCGTLHRPDASTTPCVLHFDDYSKLLLVGCTNGSIMGFNPEVRRLVWTVTQHTDVVLAMVSIPQRSAVVST